MQKYTDMFLNLFKKTEGEDAKKKTENLVVFLIIVVVTIIAMNFILNNKNKKSSNNSTTNSIELKEGTSMVDNTSSNDLEKKLESILSKISGVENVSVLVTYSTSEEKVPMYDVKQADTVTEEKDSSGGQRTTTQNNLEKAVIYKEESGTKEPIVQTTVIPKVSGVIVVANGITDSMVKTKISEAVEAVADVGAHKIQILERKK